MWQLQKWKNLNFKECSRQFGKVGQNAISAPATNQQCLLLQCTKTSRNISPMYKNKREFVSSVYTAKQEDLKQNESEPKICITWIKIMTPRTSGNVSMLG